RDDPPATADAPVVSRLRAAGATLTGRTNMTEFAFSGIGLNPHYGTPANPYDRETGRVPGGSSSGAAISVTDGTALAAIGTDTGGSVRIPSALCGLTGFKPTARRVPTDRCYPLSWTLDSVGPLGQSAADCALLDRILAGLPAEIPAAYPAKGLRLGVVRDLLFDDVEDVILQAFERALSRLSAAGAVIFEVSIPELKDLPSINANGGIASAEAYHIHREHFERRTNELDRRVAKRVGLGRSQSANDYMTHFDERRRLQAAADHASAPLDALLAPTTARIAPPIAELEASDDVFFQYNGLMLRNPSTFNFLDRCAFSIPIQDPGEAPIGLMIVGETMGDDHLLSIGQGIEAALRS
ncbi:MAG: amidase, partial [Pseudomonadota bacterium]